MRGIQRSSVAAAGPDNAVFFHLSRMPACIGARAWHATCPLANETPGALGIQPHTRHALHASTQNLTPRLRTTMRLHSQGQ